MSRMVWLSPLLGASLIASLGAGAATAQPAHHPSLAAPGVVASRDGSFAGRLEAREAEAEIPGFGRVGGLYLYGFDTGDAPPDGFGLMPPVLAVRPGDLLSFDLVNRLPCNAGRPEGTADAVMSQSNLHTHGLLVSPSGSAPGAYGDFVFVLSNTGTPPADGRCVDGGTSRHATHGTSHGTSADTSHHAAHGAQGHDLLDGAIPYAIRVPDDHPPGLYWFHPHAHGVSQQQIARGLSGLLTVGDLWDYAWIACRPGVEGPDGCADDAAARETALRARTHVDFVALKDLQVQRNAAGKWQAVEWYDAGFCGDDAYPVLTDGACTPEGRSDQRWLVTVNGQVTPVLTMQDDAPQVLRIANLSASMSYNLELRAGDVLLPFQILANDGVGVGQDADLGMQTDGDMLLLPSARLEIYLDRGDLCAALGPACDGSDVTAALEVVKWDCPDGDPLSCGDPWPIGPIMTLAIKGLDPSEPEIPLSVALSPIVDGFDDPPAPGAAEPPLCADGSAPGAALAQGQFRTIALWNGDVDGGETFTMMTDPVPRADLPEFDPPDDMTAEWLRANDFRTFDHGRTDLCVAAGRTETWAVMNLSDEFHNFHVHQSKFAVIETGGAGEPARDTGDAVLHDNFPIPPGSWIKVRVRFTDAVAGRFVYHCHILEHEDKGMMSVIEVVASGANEGAVP